jgi:hypothetical protein
MDTLNSDQFFALLPVLLVLLGVGILSIAGWLVWVFTRPGRRPGREPQSSDAVSAADHSQPRVISQAPPQFLALTRGSGGWEIFVHGRRYESLEAVPDAGTQDAVVEAIRALGRFAHDYVQRQRTTGPTPPSAGNEPAVGSGPAGASRSPQRTEPALAQTQEATARWVPSIPSMLPSINLAQEIGEIVDEMWVQTPSVRSHSVSLTNAPGGGVAFVVDGKTYREIDEIPLPEVRDLIRRATKEWERR